jgi:hypothetical protein
MIKIVLSIILLTILAEAKSVEEKLKIQNMEVVKKAAEGLNETLPQKVDAYTRLVKLQPQGERLIYIYELNVTGKSDAQLAKEGKARMTTPVSRGICNSSKRFLDSGISITYRYTSAVSKQPLFDVNVSKEDCNY